MEMELAPAPPPGLGDASAIAAAGAKRARKRSRYLSPPYTDTAVQLDVSAADVLSALLRTAARGLTPDHDAAQALHFLALYRNRRSKTFVHAADDDAGHKPLLKTSTATATGPTPAIAMPTPTKQRQKQNPPKPSPAALNEAGAGQKRASQSSEIGDVNASNSSKPSKRMRKNKKMMSVGTEMEQLRNNLPPTTINNVPPPVPKLPLRDVRNNLEKMISSLNHRFDLREQGKPAAMGNLVGQMQGLLAKVDKMLQGGASSQLD